MRWPLSLMALALWGASCKVRIHDNPAEKQGEGSACEDSEQCPLPQSPCKLAMCQDGQCVHVPAPGGSLPSDMQTQGDCKQRACDGNGNVATWGLLSDVPAEDGNPCTDAVCEKDGPKQRPKKAGDKCGDGICTGTGICGVCIPDEVKCDPTAVVRCNDKGQWNEPAACGVDKPVCSSPGDGAAKCVAVLDFGVGSAHACARFEDGTVRCWGSDHAGQLGSQGLSAASVPDWAQGYQQLALGHWHGCGVRGGEAFCWGANDFGQLGSGDFSAQSSEVAVTLSDVAEVAVGSYHSCARTGAGQVQCWGRNDVGQLGSGKAPPAPLETPRVPQRGNLRARPAPLAGILDATSLMLEGDTTCIGRKSGIACFGQGGYAIPPGIDKPKKPGAELDAFKARLNATGRAPVAVAGLSDAAQIACGGDTSCARKNDGTVWCWGAGTRGQLGDGGGANKFAPVQVEGVAGASFIGLGDGFGCALVQSGQVMCWGANDHGQLGRGPGEVRGKAASVVKLDGVKQLGVGDGFACALEKSGRGSCWGEGTSGQLGQAHTKGSAEPAPIAW